MTSDPETARIAPPAFLTEPAPAAVLAALPGARAVGGCVRDALAGLVVNDVDVAAPLPPEAIAARLRAAGLKVFETGLEHGTVTAVLGRQRVEVTALRRDVRTDGRHAEVAWTTDWREDAARRDFTINAMSLAGDGRLWDYFGGRADLARGVVRFVGEPATRLGEDYLRALRFFRFQARFGRGAPDAAAAAAIRAAVPGLGRLSAERVWMELKRLLALPDPLPALRLMRELGVLGAVLGEVRDVERLAPALRRHWPPPGDSAPGTAPDALSRLAVLLPADAEAGALAQRLRFSADEARRLSALRDIAEAPGPDALRRPDRDRVLNRWRALVRLRGRGVNPAEPLLVAEAERGGPGWDALIATVGTAPGPEFPLQGRDVLAMGVLPGPEVGALLDQVRGWWLEQGAMPDAEACRAWLRVLLAGRGGGATGSGGDSASDSASD